MDNSALRRILVVDDARLIRSYYRAALEPDGYEIDEAMNGLEALEKVLVQQVDLLIVDINMPKMDGLTFLRRLRRGAGPARSIPALLTSTEAKPSDMEAAREAGANFYLVKPIDPGALRAHVALMAGRAP
ncbi:MAG: response regulator [Burkholderiales bacterium]|nr:MAG: response regulator [Burkholderiales bacterium]